MASLPTPRDVAVDVRGLRYNFGETVAVDGADLTVHSGEIFGLLGPNGAGKTTMIRAITALLPVAYGVISVFGHDVARRRMAVSPDDRVRAPAALRRPSGWIPLRGRGCGSVSELEGEMHSVRASRRTARRLD